MDDPSKPDAWLDDLERGRTEAFGLIVRAHALPLKGYLSSHVRDADDVDDLVQDVLLTAFRRAGEFRRGCDFGAWLRGIARNKVLAYYRSTDRRARALERFRADVVRLVESDLERTAAADRADAVGRLLACIDRLPPRLRRVVRAGMNGDKLADLADGLRTTARAVYNLNYRANKLLRKCLRKEHE